MKPYDLTTHDGKTVDMITHLALLEVEQRLKYPLTITQGSYNKGGVAASAGTHDGGGVIDLAPWDYEHKVYELRRAGFFAYYRPAIKGLWPAHIHAGLIGNRKMSAGAKWQVTEYLAGRNGLATRGLDDGPRQFVNNRFSWQMGLKRINRARALIAKAQAQLASGIRGYKGIQAARAALGRAETLLPKDAK